MLREFFQTLFKLDFDRPKKDCTWFASVDGVIVELKTRDLANPNKFWKRCIRAGAIPPALPDNRSEEWRVFVNDRLEDDHIEIRPPIGMRFGEALSFIRKDNHFVLRRALDGRDEQSNAKRKHSTLRLYDRATARGKQ